MNTQEIRRATVQIYLFGRVLRRLAKEAEAELEARGIKRNPHIPVLDQLAAAESPR